MISVRKMADGSVLIRKSVDAGGMHSTLRQSVRPGEVLLGIPFEDWAQAAGGVVEIRDSALHKIPHPSPDRIAELDRMAAEIEQRRKDKL
jgi:hypothetical protein